MNEYVIYTDGSYDLKTFYGASAVVVLDKDEKNVLYERAYARYVKPEEGQKQQYSQEQELGACIRAVMVVPEGSDIIIKTDSQYCKKVLGREYEAHANLELVNRFFDEVEKRKVGVKFVKVRGHSEANGGPKIWGNDRADELCTAAANNLMSGGSGFIENRMWRGKTIQ